MAQGETFYSSISDKTVKQLRVREEALKSNNKTIDQLSFLNANSGYVKLTSGINILSSNGSTTYAGPATRFVLHGGAFSSKSGIRSGVSFEKGKGFSQSEQAYNNYSGVKEGFGLGYRPMPGITSFDLQTYNTYGTLRIANVTFTVWSLEDLDQAEKLFLRPGYSCIVEFGHSVFLDNDGKRQVVDKTFKTLSDGDLFPSEGDAVVLEKKIERKRKELDGNYDAFFGVTSNFSYNFRNDGGYDCTIKVVSKGIILDSIKNGEVTDGISFNVPEETSEDKSNQKYKTAFHFVLEQIQNFAQKSKEVDFQATLDNIKDYAADTDMTFSFKGNAPYENFTALYSSLGESGTTWYGASEVKNSVGIVYVPVSFVLDLFNKLGSLYPIGNRNKPHVSFSTVRGNKYRTFARHFSTNPANVLLPKYASFHYSGEDYVHHWKNNNIHNLMKSYAEDNGGTNQILNIFVSTNLIIELLSKVYNTQNFDTTFIDFINMFLGEINDSLSNITKLTLFFNETENKYEVVDANETSKGLTAKTINLTGLKSTITNLQIASRISSNTAAQISIAAQSGTDTYMDNVSAIRNWNKGAVDRFMKTKVSNPEDCKPTEVTNDENKPPEKVYTANEFLNVDSYKKLTSDVKRFWQGIQSDKPVFSPEDLAGIRNTLRKLNILDYEFSLINGQLTEVPIPVELSFDTLGISGFKVGQSFKVNQGILLPKYNKYGYIVTSLGHKLDTNGMWITSVGSQFFDVDNAQTS